MIDIGAVIREVLTRTTKSLYAICGESVYFVCAPDDFSNAVPAIVFDVVECYSNWISEEHQVSIRFQCFGGTGINRTFIESEAIGAAMFNDIHGEDNANIEVASGAMVSATQESAIQYLDPDTGWATSVRTYSCVLRPR